MRRLLIAGAALIALCAPILASAHPSGEAGTVARLAENGGAFVIGYRPDAFPFAFERGDLTDAADPDEQIGGYSVELCRAIAAGVRESVAEMSGRAIEIRYEPVAAGDRFEKLRSGEIDILCGPTTLTLERQKVFDFSYLTFLTQGMLLHKGTVDPLSGPIGVIENSTSKVVLETALRNQGLTDRPVVAFATHDAGLAALRAGEITGYFADRSIIVRLAVDDPTLTLTGGVTPVEPYALPVRAGDRALLLIANETLARLYRSGAIVAIFEAAFPGGKPSEGLQYLYASFGVLDGEPL